ncbi:MAG: ThuA domain-containing protein [Acidobacteria bacterium]|nr:ThuA domain-containing protein [Acidobacteriota bacterium]
MISHRLGLAATLVVVGALVAVSGNPPVVNASSDDSQGQGAAVQGAGAPPAQPGRQGGGRGRGGRAGGPARKRVLAWADTRNGQAQHESVGHALAVIERLGYESGQWDTFIRTDSHIISKTPKKTDGTNASGGPNLSNVDAIFFMGHREVPIDAEQKAELLEFVREGTGFVAAHVGLTAFDSWPEFLDLLGARFDQHPISGPGTIINESPDFPATKHFPPSFAFSDEFYQPKLISRENVDVLLRLDLANVPASPGLRLNGDYPLAWAKTYGKGRVFYGSFAHAPETWDIRDVQQMYFEAMRWALRLTDADPKPHPMRGGSPPQ